MPEFVYGPCSHHHLSKSGLTEVDVLFILNEHEYSDRFIVLSSVINSFRCAFLAAWLDAATGKSFG